MLVIEILKGLVSRVPGIFYVYRRRGTGGTDRAEYCYGVWFKHLCHLMEQPGQAFPRRVAELGPGDSLGVGLAALLCGATEYSALDVYRHADTARNLAILDRLVELLRSRAPLPADGWPALARFIDDDGFPSALLPDASLRSALDPARVAAIRSALQSPGRAFDGIRIDYRVPWDHADAIVADSLDLVISHSVLEHVADPAGAYASVHEWLTPGGVFSSQVDFSCHGLAPEWNGHYGYPDLLWRLICGRRLLINRVPASTHIALLRGAGFRIFSEMYNRRDDGISRQALAPRFRHLSDADLHCWSLFFQARKQAAG